MKARTREGAELIASLIPGNVQPPPEPRRTGGIGAAEIMFVVGFLSVCAGLAMVWVPAAFIFAGGMLAFLAWKLA